MHSITYIDLNWVIIDSGNGLLPDISKPLPEMMLAKYQLYFRNKFYDIWVDFYARKDENGKVITQVCFILLWL